MKSNQESVVKLEDKIAEVKNYNIRTVIESFTGVQLLGRRSIISPLRESTNQNGFSINDSRNCWTDWGYPDSNARGVAHGDPIDFIMYLKKVEFKKAVDILYEWAHGAVVDTTMIRKSSSSPRRNEAPDLTATDLDKAYRIFLDLCPLDQRTIDALTERGLSMEEIEAAGFKTFPKRAIRRELHKKLSEANVRPESVPGLYLKKNETIINFRFHDAILIPIKNVEGLIVGLQLRFFNKGDGPRYIWFTSSDSSTETCRYDGKSVGTPIAFVDAVKKNSSTLFITEGLFKALAINKCYGCPVLSVQGVGNITGIESIIDSVLIKYPNIKRILIAYDADFINNVNVTSHAVRLYKTMLNHCPNMTYQYVIWDEEYGKGFDDLIKNTGGWNVKSIVRTIDMAQFAEVFDKFKAELIQLYQLGKKEEIGTILKKALCQ